MSALVADGSGLALTSPGGQHRLTLAGDCLVSGDGVTYERSAGVWQILDSSRLDEVAQFTSAYARVRAAEGRGSNSAEYYKALPYQDLTGKLQSQWTQRAASFDQFGMALERIRQPGVLVDVGAGNCWLAARMAAIGWTALAIDINADLHDGLGVVCQGNIDVYPPRGRYQLIIHQIQPEGIGALELAFRQLRDKLTKEGLFEPAHKRPLLSSNNDATMIPPSPFSAPQVRISSPSMLCNPPLCVATQTLPRVSP